MRVKGKRNRTQRLNNLTTHLTLLIAFTLLTAYQFVTGRQQLLEELHTEAAIIGANSSAALVFHDEKAAHEILSAINLTPRIIGGALYRSDGEMLASVNDINKSFPRNISHSTQITALASEKFHGLLTDTIQEKIAQGGTQVGTLLLHVTYKPLYLHMLKYTLGLLVIGAIALFLTYRFTAKLRKRMVRTEEQLELMALYDRVTRLPNRRFFEQELAKAVTRVKREEKCAALLFIDVDDFKKVNDLCGHSAGDQVLFMISERLKKTIRAADIIARVGGDEFAAILYGVGDADNAAIIADEMIAVISAPFPTTPIASHVGLSIGLAMIPNDSDDPDTLLRWSDMAMYVAKSQGKNRYQFFSESINAQVHGDLQLESDLRNALKTPEGGLWVAYQPQLCTKTGKIVGIEALIRWTRSNGQSIPPAAFIPIAEKTGLISDIGVWLMQRICLDLSLMRGHGIGFEKVAVNVSPRELIHGNTIVDGICQTVKNAGESRSLFQFELTESALMDEKGSNVLMAFHRAGFSLAIDDFGSGYSSLGYLKRFQVDTLKIDRQFVQQLPHGSEDAAIVKAVIQMSKALGIKVVAEGVETQEQAEFLSENECDILQGYFISRPLPAEQLIKYMQVRCGEHKH